MAEKKYKSGCGVYEEVEVTVKEIKKKKKNDTNCIKNKYQNGEVKLGGGDSYIPLDWIQDNDELPSELIEYVNKLSNYSDLNVDI